MKSVFRSFLPLFLAFLLSGVTLAADIEGSEDHPLVGRYDGSEIVGYSITDYDEAKVIEGPFDIANTDTLTGPGFRALEGRVFLIYYKLPEGRSSLEVLRNYEASLADNGFDVLFSCENSDGSCFSTGAPDAAYFIGSAVGNALSLPSLSDDYVHNWFEQRARYLLARARGPEGAVYAAIYIGESSRGNVAVVRVVESAEMDTDMIVFVSAEEMDTEIAETGSIDLHGIQFDFDEDTIRADSRPTLDEIAKLMQERQPGLRLTIVGHTDGEGSDEYNMDLSARRAERVVQALTEEYGIAPDRLAASGAGASEPVTTNDTEEGRAENRRVELIAQ